MKTKSFGKNPLEKQTFGKKLSEKCLEKETTPLETKTTPLKKENKFLFEKKNTFRKKKIRKRKQNSFFEFFSKKKNQTL